MRISIYEGCFGGLSSNLSENYITPFALSINATPLHIGLISSFGALLSPIGQILGAQSLEKISRKKILLIGILGQVIVWPFLIMIALLYQNLIMTSVLIWFLFSFFLIYAFMGGIMTPPWFSLMGDIVPEDSRGRYFAKRNLIALSIILISSISISFMLDWFSFQEQVLTGFIIVFLIAFITRIFSFFFFTKHYYPPLSIQAEDHFSMREFINQLPKSNIGKFTLFVALITFGQWIAGPFFAVYMLQELHFSYSIFMIITLFSSIVSLFFFPLLGKFSDKFGNLKMLRFGAIVIPILPILWIFFDTPLGLLLGPQLLSGFAWTAFNLAAANFIYDNLPSQKRGKYIAYYNMLIGIGIVSGGLVGSLLITFLPFILINSFFFLFLLSGIVRFIVVLIFIPKLKEVRVTKSKPIFNVKNSNLYRWLYDILIREKRNKKNN